MQYTAIFAILAAVTPFALADCCYNDGGICKDGTAGTPCCGYGGCNIFCCNCDGGCRAASMTGLAASTSPEISDTEAFSQANTDGTGNLTLAQYAQYMGASEDDEAYVKWFNKFDKDGDGIITADEVRSESKE